MNSNKILISWLAHNNDIKDGKVSASGPTVVFHEHFFEGYSEHVILSQKKDDTEDVRLLKLLQYLREHFVNHKISRRYCNIEDPINLPEILNKIQPILLEYKDKEIDIYFSPGTSAMQMAWVLCHQNLGLSTTLLQTRPSQFSKDKSKPDLLTIAIERSPQLAATIVREQLKDAVPQKNSNYFIGKSIEPIYNTATLVAQSDKVTALILGETGTGKEHLAHHIHAQSMRKEKPFVAVNCSALGDTLLESRLFGHKKGSFTGAIANHVGFFETANGGTIFLDEIGDISPYMQQSLLRVLQAGEITIVGGNTKKLDVRIIAATNQNLPKLCEEGKFRWDLYYRLAIIELLLPPLRERGIEELKGMIYFFIQQKQRLFKRNSPIKLAPETEKHLLQYPFPGNIRQLENIIEGLYATVFDREAAINDLPIFVRDMPIRFSQKLSDVERIHIQKILQLFEGNKTQAAKALGIAYNTLEKKLGSK